MIFKNLVHKLVASVLMVALWSMSSMVALAAQQGVLGELVMTGNVTVNNRAAASNSSVASGSTVTTGDKSSATINLGKAGRVELLENTTLLLKFDDGGIYGTLNGGKIRVMSASGVTANIATREGMAIADSTQANTFAIEKECGHTHVDTTTGSVILRAEGQDKQVAAGTDAAAGNLQQTGCKPCLRPVPGAAPVPTLGLGLGALVGLLLAAGAAVATGVYLGNSGTGTEINTSGGTTVVSGVR
jgi:hypothetical protein